MSGHSHWSSIKHKKSAEDEKRGKIFSKLSRAISIAAREGGDLEINSKLRQALDVAKKFNMPKNNIDKAIKRGMGEAGGEKLEEVVFEGFGPGKVALIIEGITDNKNRALSEIKQVLQKYGGKLATEGSIKWLFRQRGIILVKPEANQEKESLELKIIEAGAEDTKWRKIENEEFLEVITPADALNNIKSKLEAQGVEIESTALGWEGIDEIELPEKEKAAFKKLLAELYELDSVQEIYSNLKPW